MTDETFIPKLYDAIQQWEEKNRRAFHHAWDSGEGWYAVVQYEKTTGRFRGSEPILRPLFEQVIRLEAEHKVKLNHFARPQNGPGTLTVWYRRGEEQFFGRLTLRKEETP